MEAGIFICENHPQLAAKINPTLAAGLGPFDPRLNHEKQFRKNYVINLTQAAMDGLEVPNLASATPKAENRTASTERLRAEIKKGQLIWTIETDTQANQETEPGSEKEPAQEHVGPEHQQEHGPEGHPKHEPKGEPEIELSPLQTESEPEPGSETEPVPLPKP